MSTCALCGRGITAFLSFGQMPIANGFLSESEFGRETFQELAVGFCEDCRMVQLTERVARERMFHDQYAFHSSTSSAMAAHFERLARDVGARYFGDDPFAVEIGSNDGILLQHYARAGIRHLGIEPSANVAAVARSKDVHTVCEFFDEPLARRILADHGPADAVLAANVMCHLPYLDSVAAGIRALLKPRGVLVFEDPYLGDIVERTSYDQIYDEHAFYFSVSALDRLFSRHAMEIVNVQPQEVHGGSMRYTVAAQGAHAVQASVGSLRARERALGLDTPRLYEAFADRVRSSRDELVALLGSLRSKGHRIAGYGATSKSTTVTNFCGITPDQVEFISDTTPIKQGKFSPGAHIPVLPHEAFVARPPDYALLFAWNHAREIMAKEQAFTGAGGKWILYVPRVGVIG